MPRPLVCLVLIACSGPSAPVTPTAAPPLAAPAPAPVAATPTPEAQARDIIALLAKQDFDAIEAWFAPEVAQALPHGQLAKVWASLTAKAGALGACDRADVKTMTKGTVVTLSCRFEHVTLPLAIGIDPSDHIAGLRVLPPAEPKTPWAPPPYAAKDAIARDVTIGDLPGTLTVPPGAGPFPAVVLVHGSGPNDRDETIGPNKPFADLAAGLAAHGIATLRYDKRTRVHPETLGATFTIDDEVVTDALAAAELLAHTPAIDAKRIYVLGHSLGGYIAPRIGKRRPSLAGLVLLAGATVPLPAKIADQLTYLAQLDGTVTAEEQAGIDDAKAAAKRIAELAAGAAPTPGEMRIGAPASYWKDLAGYDPAALAATLRLPILVLQGERDYQVTKADFAGWQKALGKRPHVKLTLYPKLTHLFIAGEGPSTPAEYEVPGHVDEQVVRDIAAWIGARSR